MLVSDQRNLGRPKWAFVHVPKTGGTSIKRALLLYANPGQVKIEGEKVTDLNGWRPHERMTLKMANTKFKDYFVFATVRNPWSWHASIWKFFQRPDRNNWISQHSFEEYINSLRWRQGFPYHHGLKPYFFQNGEPLVDFILRFENLQEDFFQVCKQISVQPIALPHLKHAGGLHYTEMYTKPLRAIVEHKHKHDLEQFGYTFER